MGPPFIVIAPPPLDQLLGVRDRQEGVHVETLVSQPAIETLDQRVLHRLAGPNEVERHVAPIRPLVERLGRELRAVVDCDRLRERTPRGQGLQGLNNALSGQGHIGLHQHTLTTPLINHGEDPKRASGGQLVMHEVHAPGLIAPSGRWHGAPVQAEPLLPSRAQPHLQPLQTVEPVDPLLVVRPAFAPEHDPDADIAEPRPGLRDLSDPHAQRRGIAGPRPVVPGVRTDVTQRTRAPAAHLIAVSNPLRQLPSASRLQPFFLITS